MKKTLFCTSLMIALMAFITSCGTTKQVQSAPDTYSSEDTTKVEVTDSETTDTEVTDTATKPTLKTKKKNAIEKFLTFGNGDDFFKYDETTVFTKEINGLKEKNATVVLRFDNQMAGFGSYNSAAYYYLQFDELNREVLAKAAEAYFSDFENKRLQRKGKRTERAYGKITYMLSWGVLSSSTPNNGTGEGYCGYEFVKGSPYFTISNYPFKNDYYERAGDATTRESPSVTYYFTRAQLRQLLGMISEENINKQIIEYNMDYVKNPSAADEY